MLLELSIQFSYGGINVIMKGEDYRCNDMVFPSIYGYVEKAMDIVNTLTDENEYDVLRAPD